MAFVSIGSLATDVLHKAKLAAAAQDTQRNEGGREPVAKGVSPSSLPIAQASGRTEASNSRMGKDRSPKAPVSDARDNVRLAIGEPFGLASVASLPVGRDMMVARNADPQGVRHEARPARVSATIISLAIWREVHGPTTANTSSSAQPKNSPKANTMIQSLLSEREVIERHP